MAKIDLIMPKMGESIMEATILKWVKKVGDSVEEDETILEIATDKVDSEIPSPVDGVISEILFKEDDVVEIGKVIAIISTEGEESSTSSDTSDKPKAEPVTVEAPVVIETPKPAPQKPSPVVSAPSSSSKTSVITSNGRFYSPLVKSIAKKENISQAELDAISGSGSKGRVTKKDMLNYVSNRGQSGVSAAPVIQQQSGSKLSSQSSSVGVSQGGTEIIEMDRMRKLIADHMVMSKKTSPHVTSFVEADVTNLFNWRSKNKNAFTAKYGEKITFTPIFIEAVVKAIGDFPLINVSVDGNNIIVKKDVNIGMAAALPSGNLIVPVIKNADYLNLPGLTTKVNDLANRARTNKLKPEEIQGGTFTVTNVGTFGNVMGTPIINQPQVAILALGAIRKKPAVIETEFGDVIAIRQMMFMSLSYDHRVVDGFLGGSFLKRISTYLEAFDPNREV
ncbi:MAG: 2-oxo acid dehydrogenase subunit E2 [Saprospiraceae bacterium]|nr:2-oxo acid dehydrogenase subunit E2 [Bacteroidia bacterium]NNE13454.1 2-oxo acid dehydrogenase subunit E2 [Saprospiraceae bacterium]NNL93823.1 2-oxo acid dehydrogenase subunit E2 [Saprospiraceae bacterium]